ncbi:hypothetical protein DL93DRAFT_2159120 [Clavulina sp. PMI_390]|nr:hypothetical protein DL93DRAFT_2159120 [Clavulina sp. PMI_390]
MAKDAPRGPLPSSTRFADVTINLGASSVDRSMLLDDHSYDDFLDGMDDDMSFAVPRFSERFKPSSDPRIAALVEQGTPMQNSHQRVSTPVTRKPSATGDMHGPIAPRKGSGLTATSSMPNRLAPSRKEQYTKISVQSVSVAAPTAASGGKENMEAPAAPLPPVAAPPAAAPVPKQRAIPSLIKKPTVSAIPKALSSSTQSASARIADAFAAFDSSFEEPSSKLPVPKSGKFGFKSQLPTSTRPTPASAIPSRSIPAPAGRRPATKPPAPVTHAPPKLQPTLNPHYTAPDVPESLISASNERLIPRPPPSDATPVSTLQSSANNKRNNNVPVSIPPREYPPPRDHPEPIALVSSELDQLNRDGNDEVQYPARDKSEMASVKFGESSRSRNVPPVTPVAPQGRTTRVPRPPSLSSSDDDEPEVHIPPIASPASRRSFSPTTPRPPTTQAASLDHHDGFADEATVDASSHSLRQPPPRPAIALTDGFAEQEHEMDLSDEGDHASNQRAVLTDLRQSLSGRSVPTPQFDDGQESGSRTPLNRSTVSRRNLVSPSDLTPLVRGQMDELRQFPLPPAAGDEYEEDENVPQELVRGHSRSQSQLSDHLITNSEDATLELDALTEGAQDRIMEYGFSWTGHPRPSEIERTGDSLWNVANESSAVGGTGNRTMMELYGASATNRRGSILSRPRSSSLKDATHTSIVHSRVLNGLDDRRHPPVEGDENSVDIPYEQVEPAQTPIAPRKSMVTFASSPQIHGISPNPTPIAERRASRTPTASRRSSFPKPTWVVATDPDDQTSTQIEDMEDQDGSFEHTANAVDAQDEDDDMDYDGMSEEMPSFSAAPIAQSTPRNRVFRPQLPSSLRSRVSRRTTSPLPAEDDDEAEQHEEDPPAAQEDLSEDDETPVRPRHILTYEDADPPSDDAGGDVTVNHSAGDFEVKDYPSSLAMFRKRPTELITTNDLPTPHHHVPTPEPHVIDDPIVSAPLPSPPRVQPQYQDAYPSSDEDLDDEPEDGPRGYEVKQHASAPLLKARPTELISRGDLVPSLFHSATEGIRFHRKVSPPPPVVPQYEDADPYSDEDAAMDTAEARGKEEHFQTKDHALSSKLFRRPTELIAAGELVPAPLYPTANVVFTGPRAVEVQSVAEDADEDMPDADALPTQPLDEESAPAGPRVKAAKPGVLGAGRPKSQASVPGVRQAARHERKPSQPQARPAQPSITRKASSTSLRSQASAPPQKNPPPQTQTKPVLRRTASQNLGASSGSKPKPEPTKRVVSASRRLQQAPKPASSSGSMKRNLTSQQKPSSDASLAPKKATKHRKSIELWAELPMRVSASEESDIEPESAGIQADNDMGPNDTPVATSREEGEIARTAAAEVPTNQTPASTNIKYVFQPTAFHTQSQCSLCNSATSTTTSLEGSQGTRQATATESILPSRPSAVVDPVSMNWDDLPAPRSRPSVVQSQPMPPSSHSAQFAAPTSHPFEPSNEPVKTSAPAAAPPPRARVASNPTRPGAILAGSAPTVQPKAKGPHASRKAASKPAPVPRNRRLQPVPKPPPILQEPVPSNALAASTTRGRSPEPMRLDRHNLAHQEAHMPLEPTVDGGELGTNSLGTHPHSPPRSLADELGGSPHQRPRGSRKRSASASPTREQATAPKRARLEGLGAPPTAFVPFPSQTDLISSSSAVQAPPVEIEVEAIFPPQPPLRERRQADASQHHTILPTAHQPSEKALGKRKAVDDGEVESRKRPKTIASDPRRVVSHTITTAASRKPLRAPAHRPVVLPATGPIPGEASRLRAIEREKRIQERIEKAKEREREMAQRQKAAKALTASTSSQPDKRPPSRQDGAMAFTFAADFRSDLHRANFEARVAHFEIRSQEAIRKAQAAKVAKPILPNFSIRQQEHAQRVLRARQAAAQHVTVPKTPALRTKRRAERQGGSGVAHDRDLHIPDYAALQEQHARRVLEARKAAAQHVTVPKTPALHTKKRFAQKQNHSEVHIVDDDDDDIDIPDYATLQEEHAQRVLHARHEAAQDVTNPETPILVTRARAVERHQYDEQMEELRTAETAQEQERERLRIKQLRKQLDANVKAHPLPAWYRVDDQDEDVMILERR